VRNRSGRRNRRVPLLATTAPIRIPVVVPAIVGGRNSANGSIREEIFRFGSRFGGVCVTQCVVTPSRTCSSRTSPVQPHGIFSRGEWGAEQRPERCSSGVHTRGAEHRPDRVRGEQGGAACSPQQNPSLPSSPRKTIQSIWGPVVGWGVAKPRAPWPTGCGQVGLCLVLLEVLLNFRSRTSNSYKSAAMSLAFDEYGRPFIIIRVRRSRKRLNVSVSLFVRDRFEFQRFHSFSVRPFPGVGGVHACCAIRRQSATVFSVARVAT